MRFHGHIRRIHYGVCLPCASQRAEGVEVANSNLTDAAVKHAERRDTVYYLRDNAANPGLMLRVGPTGAKSWSLRYRVGKVQRRYTIGDYPTFGLAKARKAAQAARQHILLGRDPSLTKQERRTADTIADLASTYMEKHAIPNKRSWRDDRWMLDTIVLPAWQHRPAKEITRTDVRKLQDEVAKRGKVLANRVRALISKMFEIGIDEDTVSTNPVLGTRRAVKEGAKRSRKRVLTDQELRQFWVATEPLPLEMRSFWRLRLITAQRACEVAAMTWTDVDFDEATWLIPASVTKNGNEHLVPLSQMALDILHTLREQADEILKAREKRGDEKSAPITHVVAGARGNRQQSAAAQTFGIDNFRGHDLRRTAATNMPKSGTPGEHISRVLNHVQDDNVTNRYNRHEYLDEKRAALDLWAQRLKRILAAKDGANVIAFARS